MAQRTCSEPNCSHKHYARGLCNRHYQRWLHGKPISGPARKRPGRICCWPGCDEKHNAKGFCRMHYGRHLAGHPMDAPRREWTKRGEPPPERTKGWINAQGYVALRHYGKRTTEHRFVMTKILGRRLHPWENVHHRNGVKTDNRPENLELWITSQPRGQRVADLVRFVLNHYSAELAAEVDRRAI